MKQWLIGALVAVVAATSVPTDAEAKRFGGGGFSGMQRNMPAKTAPNTPPPKPATPAQQRRRRHGGCGRRRAGRGRAKRSWMGPIAGLAAGLGIAALMSHLGLGEAFGNFLMIALLALAAVFLVRFVMRRMAATRRPRPGAGRRRRTRGVALERARDPRTRGIDAARRRRDAAAVGPAPDAPAPMPQPAPVAPAFVPASFDSEGFARIAKMIFIRMQAANDSADLDDLRRFTTPEMFAAARLDLQERGPAAQKTDVVHVDAEVLDVASEDGSARSSACASTARSSRKPAPRRRLRRGLAPGQARRRQPQLGHRRHRAEPLTRPWRRFIRRGPRGPLLHGPWLQTVTTAPVARPDDRGARPQRGGRAATSPSSVSSAKPAPA